MDNALLEYWPIALTTGVGLVAWGELRARISGVRKDVDEKVSKDTFQQVDNRLARMEGQLDQLVKSLVERS